MRLTLLTLVLARPLNGSGQAVQLPRVFGDNMVLQRGQHTVLWGGGGTNNMPLWLRYRGTIFQTKADPKGNWQFDLDLTKRTFESPDILQIALNKRMKPAVVELKNVAVGSVWLLAGWEQQGVPLAPSEKLKRYPDRVRFLNFVSGESGWEFYPQYVQAHRSSALPLRLAEALTQSETYVGLVRTTTDELKAGVDSAHFLKLSEEEARPVREAWLWASNDVRMAEAARYEGLVEAKRHGVLTNSLPLVKYVPLSACAGEAFAGSQGKASWLTFKAAIFPSD